MGRKRAPPSERVVSIDTGTRSLGYAYVEYPMRILRWGVIDLGEHSASAGCATLVDILHGPGFEWMVDDVDADVVIESQPRNGIIKAVSHALQTLFLSLARVYAHEATRPRTVVFCKPTSRLQVYGDLWRAFQDGPSTYHRRKTFAMRTAMRIVEGQPDAEARRRFGAFYNDHGFKARTDLADALAQAVWFLARQRAGVLPLAYDGKRVGADREVVDIDDSFFDYRESDGDSDDGNRRAGAVA